MNWNRHSYFSKEYLSKHHDIVLIDIFHKIKSFILFPPSTGDTEHPHTKELRKQIVLSLNLNTLNAAQTQGRSPEEREAIHYLMGIPEDGYFKKHWQQAYPIWLIDKEIQDRASYTHFTMIYQLIWMLICLGKTYKNSFCNEPRASIKEALEIILGDTPLKSKQTGVKRSLGGEKAYRKQLHDYKSVCHFISAFEHLKQHQSIQKASTFSLDTPSQIEQFLKISCWFKKVLLALKTPNVKNKALFAEESLIPLPSWITESEVNISIETLPEVERRIEKLFFEASRVVGG